jgi:two-component SAPR family response regulator
LSVFGSKFQEFKDEFSIRFNLSICDIKQFGYILRVLTNENQEVDLVFVNFKGEDDLYLDLHSPITHSSVQMPIHKNDIYERRGIPLEIFFDLKADKAEIMFKNKRFSCNPIGLKNPSKLKFVFGLYGLNLDVPSMVIRDIIIEEKGEKSEVFPLNEFTGDDVHNIHKRRIGTVKNPEWMINRHHFWQERMRLNVNSTAGITYNSINNQILFFKNDSVFTYTPQYERFERKKLNVLSPQTIIKEAAFSSGENKAFIHAVNMSDSDKFRSAIAAISMDDEATSLRKFFMESDLFHSNLFFDERSNTPFIFGGLEKYTYSNKLLKYDHAAEEWEMMQFTGDSILPRFLAAIGAGITSSELLLFGGFGNESGKLEYGGKSLYELFAINLDKEEIIKKWENTTITSNLTPCSNLILDKSKQGFYTLCYPYHQGNSTIQLFKFNLSDGSYRIVSDFIPLANRDMNTTVQLFFSELMQEYYAVVKESISEENYLIRIYSLLSSPVSKAELLTYQTHWPIQWIMLSIVVILAGLWLFLSKKKLNKKGQTSFYTKDSTPMLPPITKNAIYLFGDFAAYNKEGQDISYRFSSKIKSLFTLIFFHSKEGSGISTEKMTFLLWPDKDPNNAKNIRGVTINRLRNIICEFDGITLVYINSKWFFKFDSSFYCDYISYEKELHQLLMHPESKDKGMARILQILRRGVLLPSLQERWSDAFKHDFEDIAERILLEYITQLFEKKLYSKFILFSELYLNIDPLNEDVMNLCLKAFQKIGKSEQALVLYNKFVANYRNLMGEYPKKPFPDLTQTHS